jgi:hypothetical protein
MTHQQIHFRQRWIRNVGAVLKGDLWYISAPGTLGGQDVGIGDSFRALTDAPGQTATNWDILESNIGYVRKTTRTNQHPCGLFIRH